VEFRRDFVQAGGLRLHYRTAGQGPPVVMLHPSPLSSQAVLPVASAIAGHGRVFALDTPGYGLSDPLPARPDTLEPYLPVLADALDALGIGRCCLYGAATGAQLALEFASAHPQRVSLLVMDTAGHIAPEDCERLVEGYFPDVTPRADGGHLMTLWGLVRDLGVFFPWNDTRPAARIRKDLPPASFMHAMLLDYLRAGTGYDWAYRPAFSNERVERVRRCTVPALLTRWPGSIALSITDALIEQGLPETFRVLDLGPTMADRAQGIAHAIAQAPPGAMAAESPRPAAARGGMASHLLASGDGQLHARISSSGSGRPLVALHRAGASARQLERLLASMAGRRPFIAVDLPGHGDSDLPRWPQEAWADLLEQSLADHGVEDADLFGDGLGGHLAGLLQAREPRRFARLAVVSRRLPAGDAAPWPALVPALDGSHLASGWHLLRDRQLWWPWHEPTARAVRSDAPCLDAASLHAEWVDLMKCGERFAPLAAFEAMLDPVAGPTPAHASRTVFEETTAGLVLREQARADVDGWQDVVEALGVSAGASRSAMT